MKWVMPFRIFFSIDRVEDGQQLVGGAVRGERDRLGLRGLRDVETEPAQLHDHGGQTGGVADRHVPDHVADPPALA